MNFSEKIRGWYQKHQRSLPWRKQKDPYSIWMSEIILQQTRVVQGLPYYERFMEKFPTVKDFANASVDEILVIWQGLGYYSRGRNMHFAANQVMKEFGELFPTSFSELKKLKGVGDYTAAAIASIAFDEPVAVVDGNVYRVLSRYFDEATPIDTEKGKKLFLQLANDLITSNNPGEHNQALMELGALVCMPANPKCEVCPLSDTCLARANKSWEQRPIKSKRVKVSERYFHYFEVLDDSKMLIQKRIANDIWRELFELPLLETSSEKEPSLLEIEECLIGVEIKEFETKQKFIHKLSHQKITANFYQVKGKLGTNLSESFIPVDKADLEGYAFPKLITNYLSSNNF